MTIGEKIELIHHVYKMYDAKDPDGCPTWLGDYDFTGIQRWFYMIKAVICIWLWLDAKPEQYEDFMYDAATLARFDFSDRIIHPDLPDWATEWTELKIPVGWRNWFYMLIDECNY